MGQIVNVSSPTFELLSIAREGNQTNKKKKKKKPTTMFGGVIIITKVLPKDGWMDGWMICPLKLDRIE
jgi:hypothetical protein